MAALHSMLVPLDSSSLSRQALPHAGAFSEQMAKVTLLHVVPTGPAYQPEVWSDESGWGVDDALQAASAARANLAEMANHLVVNGTLGHVPDVCVEPGDPAECIVRVAEDRQVNLIIMTTHEYGAV